MEYEVFMGLILILFLAFTFICTPLHKKTHFILLYDSDNRGSLVRSQVFCSVACFPLLFLLGFVICVFFFLLLLLLWEILLV